jgi:CRP/FNR family transcriptional regulator, cyclic AMP receptor protein
MLDTSAGVTRRPADRPHTCLLDAVPAFGRAIGPEDHDAARQALMVPVLSSDAGVIPVVDVARATGHPAALLLVEGLVLRRTRLSERAACEILGRGDILSVSGSEDGSSLGVVAEHTVYRRATVAVLGDRFWHAARRWPGLHDMIHAQLAAQILRASRNLAILHLSRVDDRLKAVFVDLADRWGRVTVDGVVLDLELTHDLLGQLAGARRPTVSLALGELAATGDVLRRDDGSWVLSSELYD